MQEPLRLEVPTGLAGKRFDHALSELVPGQTRAQLQKLVRRGRVKVDGRKVVRSNFRVKGGEDVLVHLEDPHATEPPPPLDFVHVEASFAIVNKPPGLVTHPTETVTGGTLADLAVAELGPLPTIEEAWRPGVVHRLDRETSGVLVLARTPEALDGLRAQFRARTVEKRYLALVHGLPGDDRFVVDRPLGPVPGRKDLQRVDAGGREARSRFEVLERLAEHAHLACYPQTGRRHQLRVHLSAAGHPVVGDKLYRPGGPARRELRLPHHALHAESLAFDHPERGERVRFRADPPATFDAAVDALR